MLDTDYGFIIGAALVFWVLGPLLWFTFNAYLIVSRENRRLRARLEIDDVHGDTSSLPNRG